MRLAAAILWYARGTVSQGKAAEIAGVDRATFIDALGASGVSASQESAEDVRDALQRV